MFMGHYATAIVPYEMTAKSGKSAPFWLFLLGAQLLDFLMLAFVTLDIETFSPHDYSPLHTKFYDMTTDMAYTHDLLPVLGWSVLFAAFAFLVTRRGVVAAWAFGLVVFHEMLDLVVGFKHYVFGHGTPEVGFALYTAAPFAGLILEAVLCVVIVWWFAHSRAARGKPISGRLKAILYGVLIGGTLSTLPMGL